MDYYLYKDWIFAEYEYNKLTFAIIYIILAIIIFNNDIICIFDILFR